MSEYELGDGPVDDRYVQMMTAVMATIDQFFNGEVETPEDRKVGVVLLTFPYGDTEEGRCNFMSNGADREDIVCLFKEMIARFEGQPEIKGHA